MKICERLLLSDAIKRLHISASFLCCLLFLYIFVYPSSASAASNLEYQGMGISLEQPAGWTLSQSGSQISGSLSIHSSCANMTLIWQRNPGLHPRNILNQIVDIYNQGEVAVLQQKWSLLPVMGREVQILELNYKFRDKSANKSFAIWTSNLSDRLFFASMQGCEEEFTRNAERFGQILGTFQDRDGKEVILEKRSRSKDTWAILLGDLLSSHHYSDQSALPPVALYAQAIHSISPSNGTIVLSTEDKIWWKIADIQAIRAASVQEILISHGYEARLIQRDGRIWTAVQDSSGKWQLISINPAEPWRMVGVLVSDSEDYRGLLYRDLNHLAIDNLLALDEPIDLDQHIVKDCPPSKYVELERLNPENQSWMKELENYLESHSYLGKYIENVFDCSNTSQICWAALQEIGYDSRLMFSYEDHPLGQHMWVVVRYPDGKEKYVAVETANTLEDGELVHLGKVVKKDGYFRGIMYNTSEQFSRLHPEEGLWLGPGG